MKLPSFHDDYIVGYHVDCENRQIVIRIRNAYSDLITSVTITDVAGYCLANDGFGNIVLSFEEVSAPEVISEFRAEIAESYRMTGAPGPWAADLDTAGQRLTEAGMKGFLLESSYGMSGWFLAKNAKAQTD